MILTAYDALALQAVLEKTFPIAHVRLDTLGGVERGSLMVTVCLDPREKWANGIMENSRFLKAMIDHEGTLTPISMGGCYIAGTYTRAPVLRKTRRALVAGCSAKAVSAIQAWAAKYPTGVNA